MSCQYEESGVIYHSTPKPRMEMFLSLWTSLIAACHWMVILMDGWMQRPKIKVKNMTDSQIRRVQLWHSIKLPSYVTAQYYNRFAEVGIGTPGITNPPE